MAATIAAIRKSNIRKVEDDDPHEDNFLDNLTARLPPKESWASELVLGLLVLGTWHQRRIVLANDVIYFAHLKDDMIIDKIPMSEVELVRDMKNDKTSKGEEAELMIETHPDGYNSGRTYYLQAESTLICQKLIQTLRECCKKARDKANAQTALAQAQQYVGKIYRSKYFQNLVAILIIANFIVCILDAQYKYDGSTQFDNFISGVNYAFTVIFASELCVNMFANLPRTFVRSGWNYLDLLVVVMSFFVDYGPFDIPDWLVRLLRALRVVRLFGRVKELTKMFSSITASLFPMMNAFVILIIVVSIYAILGVSLFSDVAPEQFGKFNRAFLTLFQVAAGDTWIESLPTVAPDGDLEWKPALYLCTFIVLSVWIVLQVSVAVLLDNFVMVSMRMEAEVKKKAAMDKKAASQFQNPLEPLIKKLANEYTDNANLTVKLQSLFQVLDSNGSGGLTSEEFCAAMKKLPFEPKLHMTDADFQTITLNGKLCDGEGGLGLQEFERVMREQIRVYTLQSLTGDTALMTASEEVFSRRGGVKLVLMELEQLRSAFEQQPTAQGQPQDVQKRRSPPPRILAVLQRKQLHGGRGRGSGGRAGAGTAGAEARTDNEDKSDAADSDNLPSPTLSVLTDLEQCTAAADEGSAESPTPHQERSPMNVKQCENTAAVAASKVPGRPPGHPVAEGYFRYRQGAGLAATSVRKWQSERWDSPVSSQCHSQTATEDGPRAMALAIAQPGQSQTTPSSSLRFKSAFPPFTKGLSQPRRHRRPDGVAEYRSFPGGIAPRGTSFSGPTAAKRRLSSGGGSSIQDVVLVPRATRQPAGPAVLQLLPPLGSLTRSLGDSVAPPGPMLAPPRPQRALFERQLDQLLAEVATAARAQPPAPALAAAALIQAQSKAGNSWPGLVAERSAFAGAS